MPHAAPHPDPEPASLTLCLLNGLQHGAAAELAAGVIYTVGRDDACDLVLWDDTAAPRHLELRAAAGSLQLRALDAPVLLTGRILAPGDTCAAPPGTVIRLGATCLGLGYAGTDWRQHAWPEPLAAAAEPEPAAPEAPPDDAPPPDETGMGITGIIAEIRPPHPDAAPRPRRAWRTAATLAFPPLLLLTLAAAFGWPPFADREPAATPAAADPAAQAQAILAGIGLGDIAIESRPDGLLILRGYTTTQSQRDQATAALQSAGLRADNRLWPEDRLRETLTETLAALGGAHLEHDYLGQGRVRLRGYVRPGLSSAQLAQTIANDVPGIVQVDTELREAGPILDALRERLRAANLDRRVAIAGTAMPLVATGLLDRGGLARWTAILDAVKSQYHELPPLESRITLIDSAQSAPDGPEAAAVTVRGVLIGPGQAAYALLDNGLRVRAGDRIDDRYVVEEIRFDRVIAHDGIHSKVFSLGASMP